MFLWREGEDIVAGYMACSSSRRRWLSVGTVDEGLDAGMKALGAPVETPFKASVGGEGGRFAGCVGEPLTVSVIEAYGTDGHALCGGLAAGLLEPLDTERNGQR